jgi:hypothetical protein
MFKYVIIVLLVSFLLSSCSKNEDDVYYFYFISRNNDYNEYFRELVSDYADDNDILIEPLEYFPDELNSILKRDSLAWDIIEFQSSDYVYFNMDNLVNIKDSINLQSTGKNLNFSFNDSFALPFLFEIPYIYINLSSLELKNDFHTLKKIRYYFENPFEYSLGNSKILTGLPINDKYQAQKYLLTLFNFLSIDDSRLNPLSVYKFLALINISYIGTQKEIEKAFLKNKLTCIVSEEKFSDIIKSHTSIKFEKIPMINPKNFSLLMESSLISVHRDSNGNEKMINFLKYLYSKDIQQELNQYSTKFASNIYYMDNFNFKKPMSNKQKINIEIISQISNLSNYDFQNHLIDLILQNTSAEYFCQTISEKKKKKSKNTQKH